MAPWNWNITGPWNPLSRKTRISHYWTNTGILLIGSLGIKFSEILIELLTVSFKKMHLKGSSAKFCLCLKVLKHIYLHHVTICIVSRHLNRTIYVLTYAYMDHKMRRISTYLTARWPAESKSASLVNGFLQSCLVNHIEGLVQEKRNSSALAMELRLSCTKPSIYNLHWIRQNLEGGQAKIFGYVDPCQSGFVMQYGMTKHGQHTFAMSANYWPFVQAIFCVTQ